MHLAALIWIRDLLHRRSQRRGSASCHCGTAKIVGRPVCEGCDRFLVEL